MLALTYPQNKRWCRPQEWGTLGDPWTCGGHGTLESVGEGTRWHLLAGTTQGLPKPSTVKMSSVYADAHTHRHTLTLTQYPLPPLNSPSFFISYLCLLVKVLLLLLRCPESRMPSNHSGTSLVLPRQPLARPKPGFSCLGLKTIRFFSSKNVIQGISWLQLLCIENAL